MARISYENRIVARTSPDVMEGLGVLLARLQRLGWKFGGRKIGQEGLVGAAMLEFLSMSEAEQVAILGRRIPELERQLDLAGSPPAAVSDGGTVSTNSRPGSIGRGRLFACSMLAS